MNDVVSRNKLFCNEFNAMVLLEYQDILNLVRRLIEIGDKCIEGRRNQKDFTYEDVCEMFAEAIVDYSKIAYDNVILGHFDTVYMVYRAILENVVCLDIILNDEAEELWKNYVVYSYRNTILKSNGRFHEECLKTLYELYENLKIDKEFYEKGDKGKAYIDKNYGWTYKVNKEFNFKGLCALVNRNDYKDFKFASEFSHGTALHLKIGCSASIDRIIGMLLDIYIGLHRMITMYCWEEAGDEFDYVSEAIEEIFYSYIDETESKQHW